MPRKPRYEVIRGRFFHWRLANRSGVWYADGRSNDPSAGRHSLGTKDKDEARGLLHELDQQRAEDLGLAPKSDRRATLGRPLAMDDGLKIYREFYSRPLVAGGVAAGTRKRYRSAFDKFVPFAIGRGATAWNGVTKNLLIEYASHLEKTEYAPGKFYLPKTICDDITTIKQCVRHLIEEGHLVDMKPIDLQLQKPESERHYCWQPEEVQAMANLAKQSPSLAWLHAVVVGLACSGLRIGELASLRWSDVDLERQVIELTDERGHRRQDGRTRRTVKNRRSRSFPIHSDWATVLNGISRVDAHIYHSPRGGCLKPDTARNALKKHLIEPLMDRFPSAVDEQGFKDGRFHSFRHFFCSSCSNARVPERMVMEWLGHHSSEMVRHYYHLNDRESRRQMEQVNPLGGDTEGRSDDGSQD